MSAPSLEAILNQLIQTYGPEVLTYLLDSPSNKVVITDVSTLAHSLLQVDQFGKKFTYMYAVFSGVPLMHVDVLSTRL